ncbi:MAG: hypothetical protein FWH01_15140 [Oscillospiraceae bacterium]|nr:hypothetical protein [Oscillospiraceae bacterium]
MTKIILTIMSLLLIFGYAVAGPAHAAASPGASSIMIVVDQRFTTSSAYAADVFTYTLKPISANAPTPAGGSVGATGAGGYVFQISGNGAHSIGMPRFESAGKYQYELYQVVDAERPGYSYDRRTYTVEANVDSDLYAIIIVYSANGKKADRIAFNNSYTVFPTDPGHMPDPPILKTVTGNPARDSEFSFVLTALNASNPMPAGSSGGTKTVKINGAGSGWCGTWSYDRIGTFYYTVHEVNAGEKGYTYDTAIYTITDSVTEENGYLVLTRVVTNDMRKPVAALEFNNKYSLGLLGGGRTERERPIRVTEPDLDFDPDFDLDDDGNPIGNPGGGPPDDPQPVQGGGEEPNEPAPQSNNGRPGIFGPKTGDEANAALYIMLLATGGALVIGALAYLMVAGKRKKQDTDKK